MRLRLALAFSMLAPLAGCSSWGLFHPEDSPWGDNRVNAAATVQLIDKSIEKFDDQKLISLIDPNTHDTDLAKVVSTFPFHYIEQDADNAPIKATTQEKASEQSAAVLSQEALRSRRNEIQGFLLVASAQRCNVFKSYLRRLSSNEEFTFGSIATALGGVGAIVTGAEATRIFSGLAGITSGVGAQFQQDIMSNVATSVIIPGIEKRRSELMGEIVNHRCLGLPSYSLTMAIADAIRFHGACNIDVGIAEASQSINRNNDIGLDAMNATLEKYNTLKQTIKNASMDVNPQTGSAGSPGSAGAVSNAVGASGSTTGAASTTPQPNSPSTSTSPTMGDSIPVVNCGALNADGELMTQASTSPTTQDTGKKAKKTSPKVGKTAGAAKPAPAATPTTPSAVDKGISPVPTPPTSPSK